MNDFPTVSVPPDLFASTWLAVAKAVAQAKGSVYEASYAIEAFDDGIWIAGFGGDCILAGWVPFDRFTDIPTDLTAFPVDLETAIVVRDDEGKVEARAKQMAKHWKATGFEPGIQDYVDIAVQADPLDAGTLPGIGAGSIRFSDPVWHVDIEIADVAWFPWRSVVGSLVPMARDEILLSADAAKTLAALKDRSTPQVTICGDRARIVAAPEGPGVSYITGMIAIGAPPKPVEDATPQGLKAQTWTPEDGYEDAPADEEDPFDALARMVES